MANQNLIFRRDLQGLRAIAVVLIILTHAGLDIVRGGFVGVDVFFVLSGYLITGILLREFEQNGRIAFMRFYARRLKRLLPALISMLIVSFAAAIWLLSAVESHKQLASSPFATTWTSNLYFSFTKFDYFDELASRDLFLHTWSLGVEEQFYLIWPIILLMLFWLQKLKRGVDPNGLGLILAGMGMAFTASLILSLYWTVNIPQAAFYLMPSRIWQFSLGAMVYLTFQGYPSDRNWLTRGFSKVPAFLTLGAGLVLIIGSALVLSSNIPYPGFRALAPSFGAALVIIAGYTLPTGFGGPLANPILVWLGDRSYSLYLWHWPIFILGFSLGFQGQVFPTLGMALLSVLAAILSFRLVELPFWKGQWSHAKPIRIILVSIIIMSAAILVMSRGLPQLPKSGASTDVSHQWRNDVPAIYHYSCDAWYSHARVEPCVIGVDTARRTVVLLGDSVGAQWFSIVPEIFPEPLWRVIVLTKSSCPMVDEDYFYPRIGKIYQVCTDWRNAVFDELDSLKPDVLIMGNAATYDFSETQWVEGSARVFERARQAAMTVFVIPGTPSLSFDGPSCVSRHLSPEGIIDQNACLANDRLKNIESVTKLLVQAANRFPNVFVLNLNDLVCPSGNCRAVSEDGLVVFRDSQHLTDSFVRAQILFIRERLKRLNKSLDLSGSN